MKRLTLALLVAIGVGPTGCSTYATQDDIESVKRRLTSLETRLKELEEAKPAAARGGGGAAKEAKGGKGGKAKAKAPAGKAKAKGGQPEGGGGVSVDLTGDGTKVMLIGPTRNFDLPARVPPGEYAIEVTFPGKSRDVAGEVTIAVDAIDVTIECDSARNVCEAANGE